jgi:hypothetical protein
MVEAPSHDEATQVCARLVTVLKAAM